MTDATPAPLYPPTFTPPETPPGIVSFLIRCAQNPLATIPASAYRQPISIAQSRYGPRILWICDPEVIETVLVGEASRYRKTAVEKRIFRPVIGEGVLTAEGSDWRWQRRVLAPLFRPVEVLSYVPAMVTAAEELIATWRASTTPHRSLSYRPIDKDMTAVTFAVILKTMLFGGTPRDTNAVMTAGQTYLDATPWELGYGMLGLPGWLPHPAMFRLRRAARSFRASVSAIIADRRARGSSDAGDLLGRLLAARDPDTDAPLSEAQLVDNLATLLEAGHETTAKTLTWTLYLLSRAPHWQQQVREEVAKVAGPGPITTAHLEHLHVTERIIKEALRLYPAAPVMARMPAENVTLAGYHLTPVDQVYIPIYALHRHHTLWEDPNRFDPDRFLPARETSLKRTQYMPFGAGPRICLGAAFAMVEAKVLLANFVRAARFEWDGTHLPEPVSRITLHPKGGMPLGVTLLG